MIASLLLRAIACLSGMAVLAATAHVTIANTGGYGTPQATLTITIAAAVCVAVICINMPWCSWKLAQWLICAIIAGEIFGFISTGERLIAAREVLQAPLREATAKYDKARKRVRLVREGGRGRWDERGARCSLAGRRSGTRAAVGRRTS